MKKWILANIILITFKCFSLCQVANGKFVMVYGYNTIPLKIERTDLIRWMVHPSIDIFYKFNPNFLVTGSYFLYDIRFNSYTKDDVLKYSETPPLNTYDEAVMYKGGKIGLSNFENYFFAGIKMKLNKHKNYCLLPFLQLGYRTGHTELASYIVREPSFPHGFEIHPTVQNSNGIGLKIGIDQDLVIYRVFVLELSIGNYFFTKWPRYQPWIGLRMGVCI